MPIYRGSGTNPGNIYFGNNEISKVYFGQNLVWQKIKAVKFGLLYNWYTANDARGLLPIGWHVPSKTEFETLVSFIGGSSGAGNILKETGTTWWNYDSGSTNSSKFNLRGSGFRGSFSFNGLLTNNYTLSLTTAGENFYFLYVISATTSANLSLITSKITGVAIRGIKDSTILTNGQQGYMLDNDNFRYPTICIGTQEWMAANLKTTKYRNGDSIPEVTDNTAWAALTTGALCAYNNDWDNV